MATSVDASNGGPGSGGAFQQYAVTNGGGSRATSSLTASQSNDGGSSVSLPVQQSHRSGSRRNPRDRARPALPDETSG
jgi:hypothetical protein